MRNVSFSLFHPTLLEGIRARRVAVLLFQKKEYQIWTDMSTGWEINSKNVSNFTVSGVPPSGLFEGCLFLDIFEASSRLYRGRFLQPNAHWKALNDIYNFCNLLETLSFKISILKHSKILQNFENSAEKCSLSNENTLF